MRADAREEEYEDPKCRAVPAELVPDDQTLAREAKGVLLGYLRYGSARQQMKAAWQLADLARRGQDPDKAFLELFAGDVQKAMSWIASNQTRLLAKLMAKSLPQAPSQAEVKAYAEAEQGHAGEGDERRQ